MTPADLSRVVVRAVRCAVEDGELPASVVVPERVVVERTRPGGVGDYASPVAFGVAKGAGVAPRVVAEVLAPRLADVSGVDRVEVTGAGFLNFVLVVSSVGDLVRGIRADGERYGVHAPRASGVDDVPAAPARREDVVRLAALRIGLGQGRRADGHDLPVAPVAKRDGDVVAAYGADAAVWAMVAVPAHETPVFSPALLVQDESSEFFRVRYALDRVRALTRNAQQLGFTADPGDPGDVPAAAPLLAALADHPLVLEAAAHHRAPERLARQLVVLADALLDFQYLVLPKGDEKPSAAHRARLALAEAAGTVLAGGLALLGIHAIHAPDHP